MGVRQLETFMKRNVDGGVINVSIKDACLQFKEQHKEVPILVFDFLGFTGFGTQNDEETLCGGRFNKYSDKFENLLKELSRCAKLVFFEDGVIEDAKIPTWLERQSTSYEAGIGVMEKVSEGLNLRETIDELNANQGIPGLVAQMGMMEAMARKYGELIITITRECDSEIARYAYKNEQVLAIVSNDSDFLVYPGHWRYFSINDINCQTLETVEYDRQALRSFLNLNTGGLVILSTLNGNDIIKYDTVKENFHVHIYRYWRGDFRFPVLADHARHLMRLPKEQMIDEIAKLINFDREQVEKSLEMYNPIFDVPEPANDFFKFCHDNFFQFIRSICNEMVIMLTCSKFIDLSKSDIFDCKVQLFRREIGIILANTPELRDSDYEIAIIKDDEYQSLEVLPEHPPIERPPLREILDRSNYLEHDETRFRLLKFMIGIEKLEEFELSTFPQNYLQDILTLAILRQLNFIDEFAADLIMLTIKHVEEETVPEEIQAPPKLNEKAFQTTFLFSEIHMSLDNCFQVAGLTNFGKLINFDGVLFHNLYLKFMDRQNIVRQMLGESLQQYCIY